MKNKKPFKFSFRASVGLMLVCSAFLLPASAFTQVLGEINAAEQAVQCVTATVNSKKDDCLAGPSGTGIVYFNAAITTTQIGTCCGDDVTIATVRCTLLNNANQQVGNSIDIAVANLGNEVNFGNLNVGIYKLALSAANSDGTVCAQNTIDNFVTIAQASSVQLEEGQSGDETCPGSKNGSIQVKVTGGTPNFDITLDVNPPSTQPGIGLNTFVQFYNLGAGTYTITATDDNTCTASLSVTIGVENMNGLDVTPFITPVTCHGGNNGSVTLTVSGGEAPYSYQWSNSNSTSNTASNLIASSFSVTVTSHNGCKKTIQGSVTQPPAFSVQIQKTDACNGQDNGTLAATASGGTGGYMYTWQPSATGSMLSGLKGETTYNVTVTDSKGCTASASQTIDNIKPPTLSNIQTPIRYTVGDPKIVFGPDIQPPGTLSWIVVGSKNANIIQNPPNGSGSGKANHSFTLEGEDRTFGTVLYLFKAENQGCIGDSVIIEIDVLPKINSDDTPFIPEIYTPNGDGQNDIWQVALPGNVVGQFTIYNRLGGKVFEGDTLNPWDGSACPDGPYFYVLRYTQNGEEKVIKGAVTILRTTD